MISKTILMVSATLLLLVGAATINTETYVTIGAETAVQTPESLNGWWKFDEGSGSSLGETSGNQNAGTLNGNYSWTIQGVYFDGNQSYAELPINLTGYNEITVSYWANLTNSNYVRDERIFSSGGSGQDQLLLWPNTASGPTGLSWNVWTGNDKERLDSAATPTGWTQVTGTWNGTEMKLYANGQQIGNIVQFEGDATIGPTESVLIGKSGSATETQFKGTVADIKIYDIALQNDDVEILYNTTCSNYGACN